MTYIIYIDTYMTLTASRCHGGGSGWQTKDDQRRQHHAQLNHEHLRNVANARYCLRVSACPCFCVLACPCFSTWMCCEPSLQPPKNTRISLPLSDSLCLTASQSYNKAWLFLQPYNKVSGREGAKNCITGLRRRYFTIS